MPVFALLLCSLFTVNGYSPAVGLQPEQKTPPNPGSSKVSSKAAVGGLRAAPVSVQDVQALAKTYQAERQAALNARFPKEALIRADEMARRAEKALANDKPRAAARYYRDARWQLPYLPVSLPPHVARVYGESRMRHADRVNSLSYSPDGLRIASASRDGTVRIWNLGNGRELVAYRGHQDQPDDPSANSSDQLKVAGVVFHPKGKFVASVCGTQVHFWDPANGKRIKLFARVEKTDKALKCLAFSPDGKLLAVGGEDGVLRVYETATGKITYTSPSRTARIERVAYSPNGKLIAIADGGGYAAVYAPGVGNGMPMSTAVLDQARECLGVAFRADSSAIFTCGQDSKAKLFAGPKPDGTSAANTASKLGEFIGHAGDVTDLAVPADTRVLVTGGADRTVRVWDVETRKQLRSFQGHMTKVSAVAVRGDARQVASASEDGAIRLWDLSPTDDHRPLADARGPIWAVAVSPDGKRAVAAGADKMIRVYDPDSGKLEATLSGNRSAVTTVAFFPDSNRLASGGGDRVVRIWDVTTKKPIKELEGHGLPVLGVAVSADGKLVVSGAGDGTARGWDPTSGKELWKWSGKSKAICGVAIREGGKQVALAAADGSLVVLDLSSGSPKELDSISAHLAGVAAVAYSPNGTKLATVGGDGAVRIWAVSESGQPTPLARFEGQVKKGSPTGYSPLSAVAFSADGRFVASTGADAVVRIWDTQSQAEVRGLRGHTDWATSVAFGPNGHLLVSGGADQIVRIFELAPQEGAGGAGHLLSAMAVAVSPNGKLAATAAMDHTIKVWEIASGQEIATLIFPHGEVPLTMSFLGNAQVVLGTRLVDQETGRLLFGQIQPAKINANVTVGEAYAVFGAADGSKVGVWAAKPADGVRNGKSSNYELYDKSRKLIARFVDREHEVRATSFSPDLAWIATGDTQGVVRLYDANKKTRIGSDWPLFDKFAVGDLAFTPDKKRLVAINEGGLVKVANVEKRAVTAPAVQAHKGEIRGILMSPKGNAFATLGAKREVKLWSLEDPKALKELRSWTLPAAVNTAAITPDGKYLITANADGTAYVLELE